MASAQATDRLASRLKVESFDHDPGGTSATLVSPDGGTTIKYVDMKDHSQVLMSFAPSVIAGSLTKVEIVADSATNFSTNLTVIKDSGTIAADANGDYAILECDTDDLADAAASGVSLRYVAGRLTMSTGTDEAVVTYVAVPVRPQDGSSATTIA